MKGMAGCREFAATDILDAFTSQYLRLLATGEATPIRKLAPGDATVLPAGAAKSEMTDGTASRPDIGRQRLHV